jgi:hypothetical protein
MVPRIPTVFSLQGLSMGFDKTSEALKAWSGGEDKDLEVRQLSPHHPHAATNQGTLEYDLRVLGAAKPLDFILRIFRYANCAHSRVLGSRLHRDTAVESLSFPKKLPQIGSSTRSSTRWSWITRGFNKKRTP